MDKQKIIKAIEDLLDALGEDRTRVGLQETSRRVAEAYAELLSGEDKTAEIALSKTFEKIEHEHPDLYAAAAREGELPQDVREQLSQIVNGIFKQKLRKHNL